MESVVIDTTVVRDYLSGAQWITINGFTRYIKYSVEAHQNDIDGKPMPSVMGFDEVWFDINGKVIEIKTHDGVHKIY